MKRAARRRDDDDEDDNNANDVDDDGGDDDSPSSSLDEAQQMVKDFKDTQSKEKKKRRREQNTEDKNEEEEVDEEEGELFIYDQRGGDKGERRVTGVDGEEDLEDDVEEDLGIRVEPFHLREEMENGHFTADGHYVERGFNATRDAWLDEWDEQTAGKLPVKGGKVALLNNRMCVSHQVRPL